MIKVKDFCCYRQMLALLYSIQYKTIQYNAQSYNSTVVTLLEMFFKGTLHWDKRRFGLSAFVMKRIWLEDVLKVWVKTKTNDSVFAVYLLYHSCLYCVDFTLIAYTSYIFHINNIHPHLSESWRQDTTIEHNPPRTSWNYRTLIERTLIFPKLYNNLSCSIQTSRPTRTHFNIGC